MGAQACGPVRGWQAAWPNPLIALLLGMQHTPGVGGWAASWGAIHACASARPGLQAPLR